MTFPSNALHVYAFSDGKFDYDRSSTCLIIAYKNKLEKSHENTGLKWVFIRHIIYIYIYFSVHKSAHFIFVRDEWNTSTMRKLKF